MASLDFAAVAPLARVEAAMDSLKIGNGHSRVDLRRLNRRTAQRLLKTLVDAPARTCNSDYMPSQAVTEDQSRRTMFGLPTSRS